jgi:hypothetical protein
MPPLPEALRRVLAPFAPRCSHRVWLHAQLLLLGAILAPGARPVTAALRATGWAAERRFTHYPRVWTRATWSGRQASRRLLGLLITGLVPPRAPILLGADDPVDRRSGRQLNAKGCDRDAVRSSQSPVIHGCGLTWVSMMLLVAVPWSRRVWAVPGLTTRCWPANKHNQHRHKPSRDWVRQMRKRVRRWLPERRLVLVVDGGVAAGLLALAGVKSRVAMVSRVRWEAALDPPPGAQPPGKRGPKPWQGTRQRSLQAWAERSDTPWETVAVDWYGGRRNPLWVFSHTALGSTPRRPPVALRYGLVGDPEGPLRLEAFCWTAVRATPVALWPGIVMRWSGAVTFEAVRAPLGGEPQRQWSAKALARTSPVLLALSSLVTLLALQLSQGRLMPVEATAWYQNPAPPFVDCLAWVRRHLWRAR